MAAMLNDQSVWLVTSGLAVLGLLILTAAAVAEWDVLSHRWRPMVVAVIVQQAVIAYGCWEAYGDHVEVALRVYLTIGSLVNLAAAGAFIIAGRLRYGDARR